MRQQWSDDHWIMEGVIIPIMIFFVMHLAVPRHAPAQQSPAAGTPRARSSI